MSFSTLREEIHFVTKSICKKIDVGTLSITMNIIFSVLCCQVVFSQHDNTAVSADKQQCVHSDGSPSYECFRSLLIDFSPVQKSLEIRGCLESKNNVFDYITIVLNLFSL